MKTLKLIWKNKDLRNKLLIVIAILFGIRILSGIPTPYSGSVVKTKI